MNEAVRAAEERYAALFARHGEPARSSFRTFLDAYGFRKFMPLCRSVQPFFVDAATYAAAMSTAELLYRGLLAIVSTPSAAQLDSLAARPRRRALLARAVATKALVGGRVDLLLSDDGFRVIEFNPTTPDFMPFGVECSDGLVAHFANEPVVREFVQETPGHFVSLYAKLFESFVAQHHRRGGQGAPGLTIVYVPPRAEAPIPEVPAPDQHFLSLFAYLGERGINVQLCEVPDLRYEGGILSAHGSTIDAVFTAGDPEYLDFCPDDDPLLRAVRDGAVAMACGYPLGSVLDDKGLLADLSDPETNGGLEPELAAALARVIPWTRRVADKTTVYGEATIDLLAFVRDHHQTLVLKPAIGMGGSGIFLGWEMTPAQWAEALHNLPAGYVVQERVVGQKTRLPYLTEAGVAPTDLYFDLNPYVWGDGHADGCLVRLSPTTLLNLTRGAKMAPPFVLDPPAAILATR